MNARVQGLLCRLNGEGVGAVLARGSFVVLVVRSLSALLGLGLQLALARLLGVTDYGYFVYALSWVMVLAMASRLGMDNGLTRLVAQYRAQADWAALAGVLRWALKNTVIASLMAAAVAAVFVWWFSAGAPMARDSTLWIAFLVLPLLSLGVLRQGALRSLRLAGKADIPESIVRPAFMLVSLFMVWVFDWQLSAPTAMWLTVASYALAFLLGSWWLWRAMPSETRGVEPVWRAIEWWKISLPLLFIQGMQVILAKLDVLMLGMMAGPDATGVYGALASLAVIVVFGLQIVNPIAAPMISELFHTGRKRELQRMVMLAARLTTVVTIVAVIFLIVFGKQVLGLFGAEFVVGYRALMILLGGQIMNALCGSVGYLMTMTGHQNQSAIILAFTAALNIGLNWLLIPRYGIEGAAVATAVSIATWNIAMLVYVRLRIGVRSTVF